MQKKTWSEPPRRYILQCTRRDRQRQGNSQAGLKRKKKEPIMHSTTLNNTAFAPAAAAKAPAATARPSFARRIFDRLTAAQEHRARKIVHAHLAHQPDEALVRLGWSAADIAALRASKVQQPVAL
jgi:hypothetical protein